MAHQNSASAILRPVEVRLRDLPTVETVYQFGSEYAQAGEWTLDPREEPDVLESWENAKAWAAYALWLQNRQHTRKTLS